MRWPGCWPWDRGGDRGAGVVRRDRAVGADAGPEVLAVLGAARGAAEKAFRRAFALASPDVLDRVLGAWLHTRAVQAGGRLVIAIDGKTVRGAKNKDGKAPHLVAALAHGIGAVLGQAAVDEKSNEIPAVRDLLKRSPAWPSRCPSAPPTGTPGTGGSARCGRSRSPGLSSSTNRTGPGASSRR